MQNFGQENLVRLLGCLPLPGGDCSCRAANSPAVVITALTQEAC